MITDLHLANCIRRIREELQDNRPVVAHTLLGVLEKYLADEEFRPTKKRSKDVHTGKIPARKGRSR